MTSDSNINPQMIIVTLVHNDRWCGKRCPNCLKMFRAGEDVFESLDQQTALHVTCIVALALVASLHTTPERSDTEPDPEHATADDLLAAIDDLIGPADD